MIRYYPTVKRIAHGEVAQMLPHPDGGFVVYSPELEEAIKDSGRLSLMLLLALLDENDLTHPARVAIEKVVEQIGHEEPKTTSEWRNMLDAVQRELDAVGYDVKQA